GDGYAVGLGLLFHLGRRRGVDADVVTFPFGGSLGAERGGIGLIPYLILRDDAGELLVEVGGDRSRQLAPFVHIGWNAGRRIAGARRGGGLEEDRSVDQLDQRMHTSGGKLGHVVIDRAPTRRV